MLVKLEGKFVKNLKTNTRWNSDKRRIYYLVLVGILCAMGLITRVVIHYTAGGLLYISSYFFYISIDFIVICISVYLISDWTYSLMLTIIYPFLTLLTGTAYFVDLFDFFLEYSVVFILCNLLTILSKMDFKKRRLLFAVLILLIISTLKYIISVIAGILFYKTDFNGSLILNTPNEAFNSLLLIVVFCIMYPSLRKLKKVSLNSL
jgi:thiamine transporter ThiT